MMLSSFPSSSISLFCVSSIMMMMMIPLAHGLGSDYLDPLVAPMTVYEDTINKNPQNMDFDTDQNMFVAHSGWYQDHLIHYYKFRMFTPDTYPGVLAPGVTSAAVPRQNVYFVTETGDFSGVVGKPIIEYHITPDGVMYSDFMVVNFVTAPTGYVADTFKSVGDIMEDSSIMVETTNIVLNMPVVPTGSTLQDPMNKTGGMIAPIDPVPVFYKGVEVWTYVFEVTDQSAADYLGPMTRTTSTSTDISPERAAVVDSLSMMMTTGFEITVLPNFATADFVAAIPIWHVNQFSRGVTIENANGGGPNPMGMRNVIDMDRPDPGYSPLWQIYWATEMPIDYTADELSNAMGASMEENGFMFVEDAPMYVNCPNIGLVGTTMNPMKKEKFQTMIDASKIGITDGMMSSFAVIGSHASLIMQGGVPIKFMSDDGTVVGTTETNMMGGYEAELMASAIPADAKEINVLVAKEGEEVMTIRTIKVGMVMDSMGSTNDDSSSAAGGLIASIPAKMLGAALFLFFGLYY